MTPADSLHLKLRTPVGLGWRRVGRVDEPSGGSIGYAWQHAESCTQVISAIALADLPKGVGVGLQWHVSIVGRPRGAEPVRPTIKQVVLARCAFDMIVSEEDNHHPGSAVHFWLPVDPAERVDCECKETEVQVVEPDGYRWSNDPGACRGCDLESSMRAVGLARPCPFHRSQEAR